MKNLKEFVSCIFYKIKKSFRIYKNDDIYHACNEKLLVNQVVKAINEKDTEEYLINYATTTRWQTV